MTSHDACPVPVKRSACLPWYLAYAIPAALFLAIGFEFLHALVAPLAGPFAAQLWGHSCGLSSHLPGPTAALTIAGPLFFLAWLRWRNRWILLPLALWYLAWIAAGFLSMINVYE